jgi:hypothetical protein
MTKEQRKRIQVTALVCLSLYVALLFVWGDIDALGPLAIICGGFFAYLGGVWIGLIVTGVDLVLGDYFKIVNRRG